MFTDNSRFSLLELPSEDTQPSFRSDLLTINRREVPNPIYNDFGEVMSLGDFATDLIAEFGYVWHGAQSPFYAWRDGKCFAWAKHYAGKLPQDYLYCEGSSDGYLHAWLLGRDGKVWDPSYGPGKWNYVGTPFRLARKDNCRRGQQSILLEIESRLQNRNLRDEEQAIQFFRARTVRGELLDHWFRTGSVDEP